MHGRRNIPSSGHLNMAFSDIVYDSSFGRKSSGRKDASIASGRYSEVNPAIKNDSGAIL
jgi:hypothetical protein